MVDTSSPDVTSRRWALMSLRHVVWAAAVGVGALTANSCADNAEVGAPSAATLAPPTSPDSTVDRNTSTSTIAAPAPMDPVALSALAALAPADLGAGWVECCPPLEYSLSDLDLHSCSAPPGMPDFRAGYQRQYSYLPTPEGMETANMFGGAFVADSLDAAVAEFEALNSPANTSCLSDQVNDFITIHQTPVRTGPVSTIGERVDSSMIAVPATVDRFRSVFETERGSGWVNTDVIQIRVDDVLHRLQFRNYSSPIPIEFLECVANSVAARVKATEPRAQDAPTCQMPVVVAPPDNPASVV